MRRIILVFGFLFSIICYGQKVGDSEFMIKMNEEHELGHESDFSTNVDFYDSVLTYVVVPNGHYIYYYIFNGKCTGITEKIIGTNLKQTYKLYKNILDTNNFGYEVSKGENYTCFKKNGSKLQVIIEEGYSNNWDVMINKGFQATWNLKNGC